MRRNTLLLTLVFTLATGSAITATAFNCYCNNGNHRGWTYASTHGQAESFSYDVSNLSQIELNGGYWYGELTLSMTAWSPLDYYWQNIGRIYSASSYSSGGGYLQAYDVNGYEFLYSTTQFDTELYSEGGPFQATTFFW